ncbi:unnamed protein product [Cylindrotheca closterium]|uniref:RRM domain-containing protein n=1 Tax=Cylindrotheca closterium TaxID=2856 RepID=A0AAD2CGI3_9STRA|nr:unnamed protein product [Cylindrotheca closterium]
MEGVPLPPGIPGLGGSTDPLEAVLGPFPCTRLRNLPFDTTVEDLLVFFQGLVVIDLILIGSGEAYIVFANPMDFQMALQRDRQTIRRTYIEISPASRSDYYDAVSRQHWQEQPRDGMLISGEGRSGDDGSQLGLEGLWGASAASAPVQSLAGQQMPKLGGSRGGPLGLAVSGGSRGGPGRGVGGNAPPRRTGGGIQIGEHTGFLRMRGLPFSATKDDIAKFFAIYNPVLDSIVLTYRSDGRATGEAYVAFESPDASRNAMDLHRKSMGSRYIELFLSNKEEHGRALARFGNR